jgi:hypothetical protein
MTPKYNDTAR